MGHTKKQYLRYVSERMFGIIGSGTSIHFVTRFNQRKYLAVSACEKIFIWDLRTKQKVLTLTNESLGAVVSTVLPRPHSKNSNDNSHIAVGYSDGTLALFDTRVGQSTIFHGHKGAISTLAWDENGMRIASGSVDGEIVIWDIVSEKGIVRLKGHKGRINKVSYMKTQNTLVSCAKDSFIKFWDLDTNHCFYTLAKHHTEIWDFVVLKNDTRLVVGGSNAEMRVWALNFSPESIKIKEEPLDDDAGDEPSTKFLITKSESSDLAKQRLQEEDFNEENPYLKITDMGFLLRSKPDRVYGMFCHGQTLVVHGKSPLVDVFAVYTHDEALVKREKRLKKARKRARENQTEIDPGECDIVVGDEFKKLPSFKASAKVNSIAVNHQSTEIKIATLHADNSLAVYDLSVDSDNKPLVEQDTSLYLSGHRNEIRSCCFNWMADQIVTASADSIKIWNRADTQVVRSIACDYPLCVFLPPGDRHAVVGTKSGRVQLFELASGEILDDVEAHTDTEAGSESGVWALALTHDGRGFVSGGSDCLVKFWSFDLVENASGIGGKRLSIAQDRRALKVADQITALRCSKSGKFLAVATFDMKETLYYMDSLKLLHEFYGKPMPSTCLDFSHDSSLIAAGSKDSCIRIFATDFGDQKRLMKNCHQGGVTDVQFIAKTHMFFSCGADGAVKQWDADNFERIITLKGHHGIARCLGVSLNGEWVVSCGQDRSVRLWHRTNEPLILEEEREDEREREGEGGDVFSAAVVAGEKDADAVRATKTSKDTEKAADQLIEALFIYQNQVGGGNKAEPNELMTLVYKTDDPLKFVLLVLRKIKASELEEAVLVLPQNLVLVLLMCLKGILDKEWDIELASRVLVVALRANLPQLVASKQAVPVIRAIASSLPQKTQSLKDLVGFNLAGLRHLQSRLEQKRENQLFVEAAQKVKSRRRKKKREDRITKRAILTI